VKSYPFNMYIAHYTDNKELFLNKPVSIKNRFIIFYVVSGEANCTVNNSLYKLNEGDIIILNSLETYKIDFESKRHYEYYEIGFCPDDMYFSFIDISDMLHCFINRTNGDRNKISLTKWQMDQFLKLLEKIEFYTNTTYFGNFVLRFTSFIELLVYINDIYMNIPDSGNLCAMPEKMVSILEYIDNNTHEPLLLSSLEEKFYLSKYHLCRIFKRYTGTSLHKYIVSKRIMKAQGLLGKGVRVNDACQLAGFNDYSNFVKTFKKFTGMSPLQFFKKYSNKGFISDLESIYSNLSENSFYSNELPDLIVTGISCLPSGPVEGDSVRFMATVKNIGKASTPPGTIIGVGIIVQNKNGDVEKSCWSDNRTLPLGPEEEVLLTASGGENGIVPWTAKAGIYKVTAFVNDVARINESKRDNNIFSKSILIKKR